MCTHTYLCMCACTCTYVHAEICVLCLYTHIFTGTLIHTHYRHPEGCTRQPSFGDPVTGTLTHCSKHRSPQQKDLKNLKCAHEVCVCVFERVCKYACMKNLKCVHRGMCMSV
jgi:hypothetical protein